MDLDLETSKKSQYVFFKKSKSLFKLCVIWPDEINSEISKKLLKRGLTELFSVRMFKGIDSPEFNIIDLGFTDFLNSLNEYGFDVSDYYGNYSDNFDIDSFSGIGYYEEAISVTMGNKQGYFSSDNDPLMEKKLRNKIDLANKGVYLRKIK